MSQADVLIVGAGLAGLCCARTLREHGVSCLLLEASDGAGGRVRTDTVEGFRLDRGFQVLLTAYPEAQARLDYASLRLYSITPGATVWTGDGFARLHDPFRHPGGAFATVFSAVGGLRDKLRVAAMRRELLHTSIQQIFSRGETSARAALLRRGFSSQMIDRFFRPFFGGIQLDATLGVSSRMFEFVFKMLAEGDAALPAGGMQAIPDQLAAALPEGSIRFGARVHSIERNHVRLDSGEELTAEAVVVACDAWEAAEMLPQLGKIPWRSVTCAYYAASEPPQRGPVLILNGSGAGSVNHLAVLSEVAPEYAPAGQSLISATVLGIPSRDDETVDAVVRGHLLTLYGDQVKAWRLLRVYRIAHAQPAPAGAMKWLTPTRLAPGLYACGDYLATPSIQGAMESGRRAAGSLLDELAPALRASPLPTS